MMNSLGRFIKNPSVILAICIWTVWFCCMLVMDKWHLLQSYGFVSLTMAFGSFIAGATSEGGGAVAFPVLTIFFNVAPPIARDFALAIQSVGMTAAALAIYFAKIPIEKRAVIYAMLGGIPGMAIGLYVISPLMPPVYAKMFFVSLWLSFGVVVAFRHLFNTKGQNKTLREYSPAVKRQLFALGVIGGAVSGITGSGIDIVVFSYLVLQHRLDIRIATPTSVVLMASNAMVGIAMRILDSQPIADATVNFWWVSIPIVVIGAPLGARFIATRSVKFVAALLCATIFTQFMGAILIVPQTVGSVLLSVLTFTSGFLLFSGFFHKRLGSRQSG